MKGLFIPEITAEMFRNGCLESIEALMAEGEIYDIDYTGWIPVSERLPDAEYGEGDSVLCCTESGLMYILYWNGGNWCVPTGEPHHWVNHKTGWRDKVIAWQPLPEPYKGGDADMGVKENEQSIMWF